MLLFTDKPTTFQEGDVISIRLGGKREERVTPQVFCSRGAAPLYWATKDGQEHKYAASFLSFDPSETAIRNFFGFVAAISGLEAHVVQVNDTKWACTLQAQTPKA
jgi:hypothetical protein